MFGFVMADMKRLSKEEKKRYQAFYCGICKSLKDNINSVSRISLTYDMVFLVLLLSSVYESEEEENKFYCAMKPIGSKYYIKNNFTSYAAYMNIALCYNNFLDDWKDDKNLVALTKTKIFEKGYEKAKEKYPEKCSFLEEKLDELYRLEQNKVYDIDVTSNTFGEIMSEIFCFKDDEYANSLRRMGFYMGKAIYFMDAAIDLKKDIKKDSFNPLVAYDINYDRFTEEITILMGEAAQVFKELELKQDYNIIENILYAGIWIRYDLEMMKIKNKESRSNGK